MPRIGHQTGQLVRATDGDRTYLGGNPSSAAIFNMIRSDCDGRSSAPRFLPCPLCRIPHETALRAFEEPALDAMFGPVAQAD